MKNACFCSPASTAIDKVKRNSAVSHPANLGLVNPGYRLKNYVDPTANSGVPSFNFGDTPPSKPKVAAKKAVEINKSAPKVTKQTF